MRLSSKDESRRVIDLIGSLKRSPDRKVLRAAYTRNPQPGGADIDAGAPINAGIPAVALADIVAAHIGRKHKGLAVAGELAHEGMSAAVGGVALERVLGGGKIFGVGDAGDVGEATVERDSVGFGGTLSASAANKGRIDQ